MTRKHEASVTTNERVVTTRASGPVGPVPLARDRSTTRVKSAERTHGAEVAGEHVARNRRNEANRPDALVPIAIGLVRASRNIVETKPTPPARAPECGRTKPLPPAGAPKPRKRSHDHRDGSAGAANAGPAARSRDRRGSDRVAGAGCVGRADDRSRNVRAVGAGPAARSGFGMSKRLCEGVGRWRLGGVGWSARGGARWCDPPPDRADACGGRIFSPVRTTQSSQWPWRTASRATVVLVEDSRFSWHPAAGARATGKPLPREFGNAAVGDSSGIRRATTLLHVNSCIENLLQAVDASGRIA